MADQPEFSATIKVDWSGISAVKVVTLEQQLLMEIRDELRAVKALLEDEKESRAVAFSALYAPGYEAASAPFAAFERRQTQLIDAITRGPKIPEQLAPKLPACHPSPELARASSLDRPGRDLDSAALASESTSSPQLLPPQAAGEIE